METLLALDQNRRDSNNAYGCVCCVLFCCMSAHTGTSPHIRVGLSPLLCHQTLDETLACQHNAAPERVVWTLQLFPGIIDSPETGGYRFTPIKIF